ncbi:MAG: EAL domain-containing protein [Pseudomonadota bacterium]
MTAFVQRVVPNGRHLTNQSGRDNTTSTTVCAGIICVFAISLILTIVGFVTAIFGVEALLPIFLVISLLCNLGAGFYALFFRTNTGFPSPGMMRSNVRNSVLAEPFGLTNDLSSNATSRSSSVDPLTGLQNRHQLALLLPALLSQLSPAAKSIALLVIDVRRLREINGYHGYRIGDGVLQQIGRRIAAFQQDGSIGFRIGSDHFALVIRDVAFSEYSEDDAQVVQNALARPMHINGCDITPEVNVGVALAPLHARTYEQLLRSAELALDVAKRSESSEPRVFKRDMDAILRSRRSIERELKRAMKERTLELHYQPQFDLRSGTVCGVEALMRWRHPEWGMVPPTTFISVAESSGLIRPMGVWLLHQACRQIVAWRNAGHDLSMAVNISAAQLRQPEMARIVRDALVATNCEPERLELEVTESLFVDPSEITMRLCLNRIAEMGVRLAIDDFGTGYSSLAYLKRLPVGKIKIDKSFLVDIGRNNIDEELVRAIIGLAKTFGKDVLAEGVEQAEQRRFLDREGCDQAQGYYFARPMPANQCTAFLETQKNLAKQALCA